MSANSTPRTTVAYSHKKDAWAAACQDCQWIGPTRDAHGDARQDQIDHLVKKHREGPHDAK